MHTKSNKISPALAAIAQGLAEGFRPGPKRPAAETPKRPKLYFADNSRQQPNAHKHRALIEAHCTHNGVVAEWPAEHDLFPTSLTTEQRKNGGPPIDDPAPGRVLHKAWYRIGHCDAVVAETTPFRGVHMNPLVAFEVGIAVVHSVPVFAWTKDFDRRGLNSMMDRLWPSRAPDGNWRDLVDDCGDLIENFGMNQFAQIAGNFVSLSPSLYHAIAEAKQYLATR